MTALVAGGFDIRKSELSPDGSVVWLAGSKVIGIWSPDSERERFLSLFGLTRAAPDGATGCVLSAADYDALCACLEDLKRRKLSS